MDTLTRKLKGLLARLKGDFNESDHPRDDSGKFGSGGGNSAKPAAGSIPHTKPNKDLPKESRPQLTPSQAAAVRSYTDDTDEASYDPINKALRIGAALTDKEAEVVKGLDEAIASAQQFAEPVTTWRGLGFSDRAEATKFVEQCQQATAAGKSLHMGGFLSTTTDHSVIEGKTIALQIEATHGLDANSFSNYHEKELLLGRHEEFEVVSVRKATDDEEHDWIISLKQIAKKG